MLIKAVSLEVDSLHIAGRLYLPDGLAPGTAVGICHGVPSGNPPDPDDGGYPRLAERLCGEGMVVFIFNFRGTGASGGNFDIRGWTADLGAVVDYLSALPGVDRIALLGFSAGAAVAIDVAARDERVSAVVACASPARFTLFTGVGDIQPLIERFRSTGIIRDRDFPPSIPEWQDGFRLISPVDRVADIAPRPLLLVHGDKDDVVDVSHARSLYDGAGEPRELVIVEGAGHRLRRDERAMAVVINWLKSRCGLG